MALPRLPGAAVCLVGKVCTACVLCEHTNEKGMPCGVR